MVLDRLVARNSAVYADDDLHITKDVIQTLATAK